MSRAETYGAGLFPICATQSILFKQMGKKTLDKILRFGRSMTPASQKGIKGWPIRFTEIGKRFSACFCWIRLSSAQNQSPVRRLKPSSSFLQCSVYRFHKPGFAAVTRLRRCSPIPERMISLTRAWIFGLCESTGIAESLAVCEPDLVGNDFFDLGEFGEDDLSCAHKLVTPCPCGFSVNRAVAWRWFRAGS